MSEQTISSSTYEQIEELAFDCIMGISHAVDEVERDEVEEALGYLSSVKCGIEKIENLIIADAAEQNERAVEAQLKEGESNEQES